MTPRNGEYLYWIATGLAAAIAMTAGLSYVLNVGRGMPILSAAALLLAAAVWLIGWAGRHTLTGR